MKTHSIRRPNGFTLVELLVVIAIIAVLAGAGFAAANAAMQRAKRTTAMATCVAIESAITNFYTEYSSMPTDASTSGSADAAATVTTDVKLLNVLLGNDTTLNPKGVRFLAVKEGKAKGSGGINGLLYSSDGATVKGLYDPWGGPYYVLMDTGYDEKVSAKTAKDAAASNLNRKVAVWSNGADGVTLGEGTVADDVRTWDKK